MTSSMPGWPRAAVAHLRYCKSQGMPWEDARKLTAHAVRIPNNAQEAESLLELANTQAAFFWRVAENAYKDVVGPVGEGNGPSLRHWSTGMLDDDTGPAETGIAA